MKKCSFSFLWFYSSAWRHTRFPSAIPVFAVVAESQSSVLKVDVCIQWYWEEGAFLDGGSFWVAQISLSYIYGFPIFLTKRFFPRLQFVESLPCFLFQGRTSFLLKKKKIQSECWKQDNFQIWFRISLTFLKKYRMVASLFPFLVRSFCSFCFMRVLSDQVPQ